MAKKTKTNENIQHKAPDTEIQHIPYQLIEESTMNNREYFDEAELNELAESIKEVGLLQAITVRTKKQIFIAASLSEKEFNGKDCYEIIIGARRYRACIIAGYDKIPCVIREMSDEEAYEAMLTENLQRKDVRPMEEARGFKRLQDTGKAFAEIALRIGKPEKFIRQRIKLCDLIPSFVEMLEKEELLLSHAYELCKLRTEDQEEIFRSHYNKVTLSWNDWNNLTPSQLKNNLRSSMNNLEREEFDKTECLGCSERTGANMLFEDFGENRCLNSGCFAAKKLGHRAAKIEAKIKEGYMLVCSESDSAIKTKLIEMGYTPLSFTEYDREFPLEPVTKNYNESEEDFNKRTLIRQNEIREQEEQVENGELLKAIAVGVWGDDTIIYISPKEESPEEEETGIKDNTAIKELKDQDKKNKDKRQENTVKHLRKLMGESDYSDKAEVLSENERTILYAVMLTQAPDELKEEIIGEDETKIIEIVNSLSQEKKNRIARGFIKERLDSSATNWSQKLQTILQTACIEIYPEPAQVIIDKYERTYQIRKTKLDEQIKAIKNNN